LYNEMVVPVSWTMMERGEASSQPSTRKSPVDPAALKVRAANSKGAVVIGVTASSRRPKIIMTMKGAAPVTR